MRGAQLPENRPIATSVCWVSCRGDSRTNTLQVVRRKSRCEPRSISVFAFSFAFGTDLSPRNLFRSTQSIEEEAEKAVSDLSYRATRFRKKTGRETGSPDTPGSRQHVSADEYTSDAIQRLLLDDQPSSVARLFARGFCRVLRESSFSTGRGRA